MIGTSSITSGASPPVAITVTAPGSSGDSSLAIRRPIPSTCPAKPYTIPDCKASTVFLPITRGGLVSSTLSSCAARLDSASTEISIPGASAPPTNSPRALTASKFVEVPKSTTISSAVRSGTVAMRQCSTIASASNTPSTVLVFPMSIVSSMLCHLTLARSDLDRDVVDEPRAAQPGSDSQHRGASEFIIPNGDVGPPLDEIEIIHGESRAFAVEDLPGGTEDRRGASRGGRRPGGERALQDGRHRPLG